MASSMIHLAIVQEMRKEVSFRDINRLFLGVILPDGAVAGNSHLKKKICKNTRYTYDLEFFRDRYGKYMEICYIGDLCMGIMAGIRALLEM